MIREQLLAARDLIKAKRYDDARALLQTINHPKATEWLQQLDAYQVRKQASTSVRKSAPQKRGFGSLVAVVTILVVVLVGAGTFVAMQADEPDSAAAQTDNTVRAYPLVDYFPAGTVVYASTRTDDDTIDALDDLLTRVTSVVTNDDPPVTLWSALDELAGNFGGDFQTMFDSWLGDYAAFGIPASDNFDQMAAAFAITDSDQAATFIENVIAYSSDWTRTEQGDYSVFANTYDDTVYAVGSDVLLVATDASLLPLDAPFETSLGDSEVFTAAMARLPQDSYGLYAYLDVSTLFQGLISSLSLEEDLPPTVEALSSLKPYAIGGTLLDDRSLVLDMAAQYDPETIGQFGFSYPELGAVDPDFMRYVPSNATLVLQSTDLNTLFEYEIEALRIGMEQGTIAGNPEDIDEALDQIDTLFETFGGINFRDDVIGWMTGDYALYLVYEVPEPGTPSLLTSSMFPGDYDLNMEVGLVIEATDPAKAAAIVDAVESALTTLGGGEVDFRRENIAGANALVVSLPLDDLTAPLEIVFAANDDVLVIGTRSAAEKSLNGNGNLNGERRFNEAEGYMLDDASFVFYVDRDFVTLVGDGMITLGAAIGDTFAGMLDEFGESTPVPQDDFLAQQQAETIEAQQLIRELARVFNSATMSSVIYSDGSLTRMVLTFSE